MHHSETFKILHFSNVKFYIKIAVPLHFYFWIFRWGTFKNQTHNLRLCGTFSHSYKEIQLIAGRKWSKEGHTIKTINSLTNTEMTLNFFIWACFIRNMRKSWDQFRSQYWSRSPAYVTSTWFSAGETGLKSGAFLFSLFNYYIIVIWIFVKHVALLWENEIFVSSIPASV